MSLPFILPPLSTGGAIPYWEGSGFRIGNEFTKILQYSINNLGWNDDLTFFHEDSAGDQHFIDKASRDYAIEQLKKNVLHKNPTILEVGCSSGFMLQRIHKSFPHATVIGSDVVSAPLHNLSKILTNTPLFQFDLTQCPFPDNSVDAVVILNVLEHIEHDADALSQIYRILKPGGVVIIEVPAGPHLYDIYDKVLMHFRRYTLHGLRSLVKSQGFVIKKQSHLGFFIYPGFKFVKQRNKKLLIETSQAQQQLVEKNIRDTGKNPLFHAIMQSELLLGRLISYPVGIRCLMTCIKI